jgi:hypothetical protein
VESQRDGCTPARFSAVDPPFFFFGLTSPAFLPSEKARRPAARESELLLVRWFSFSGTAWHPSATYSTEAFVSRFLVCSFARRSCSSAPRRCKIDERSGEHKDKHVFVAGGQKTLVSRLVDRPSDHKQVPLCPRRSVRELNGIVRFP